MWKVGQESDILFKKMFDFFFFFFGDRFDKLFELSSALFHLKRWWGGCLTLILKMVAGLSENSVDFIARWYDGLHFALH